MNRWKIDKISVTAVRRSALAALLFCNCFLSNPAEDTGDKTGIADFKGAEEIYVAQSTSEDVRNRLGEPEIANETASYLFYYYPSMGLKFTIDRIADRVIAVYVYGEGWRYNVDGVTGSYEKYAYTTEAGIGLNDSATSMVDVVAHYGDPDEKGLKDPSDTTGASPWYYKYTRNTGERVGAMQFYFFAPDSNYYAGRDVILILIY